MALKPECIAMLLAGGQGSRLGILTKNIAKPAVPYGGKYRIIDFPLSNCVNSGINTVGVLTQYQPLELNDYIGNGQPWDLDRANGGVHILSPYQQIKGTSTSLKDMTPNTFSFFPATIFIRWTMQRCLIITRKRTQTAPSQCLKFPGMKQAASV